MIHNLNKLAAVTALLVAPSLAQAAPPADPFGDDAAAEGDAAFPASAEPEGFAAPGDASALGDAPGVLHPELAAAAPQPAWVNEGGDGGGAAEDPRALNRKIRRAGVITLAGGGIAVIGGAIAISGALILYVGNPRRRLYDLADDNGGWLPVDSGKRHRAISMAYAGPVVVYAGLGVLAAGVITAGVARLRLKKLRERRKSSAVALAPAPIGRGAMLRWEVRF
ncbi:MAG: hypothetical protein H6710_06230 [Myxococcales bacterium]|nr:hypothetical protein [Myxococcales bacterium]MCB9704536.1 hypothetical protein [Myxococcales bacterium]